VSFSQAQDKYFTRNGKVNFVSDAPLEKIPATNTQGTSVFVTQTGQFEFAVLMKAFEFEKALMQEHFNENYAESDKFPKAGFKGVITNITTVNLLKDGVYPITVKGKFTMHGVTNDKTIEGTIEVKDGKVVGKSNFEVNINDYGIQIPSLVRDKVSKIVKVTVEAPYAKM
jgi:polyisoprenoid-binding protein YceI